MSYRLVRLLLDGWIRQLDAVTSRDFPVRNVDGGGVGGEGRTVKKNNNTITNLSLLRLCSFGKLEP